VYIRREKGPVFVVLPDGSKLTRSDLPPINTRRWVARRKATVVAAVDHGLIEASEACSMYHLSDEELDLWRSAVRRHGASALRVTAIQKYRQL
jgi:alpha-beta hydrolase superfamily lysophospholipase